MNLLRTNCGKLSESGGKAWGRRLENVGKAAGKRRVRPEKFRETARLILSYL